MSVLIWTVVVIPELIIPSENRTDDSSHVQGKKRFISLCFLTLLSVRSLFHHKRMHFLDFPCVSCIISIMVSSCTNSSLCCGLKTRPQHKVADVLCNVFCFSGKIKNTCQPFQLFHFWTLVYSRNPNCHEGWQQYGERCFRFIDTARTWAEAEVGSQTISQSQATVSFVNKSQK